MNREQLHDRITETLCAAEHRWRRPTGILGAIVTPQTPAPLIDAMAAAVVDLLERDYQQREAA